MDLVPVELYYEEFGQGVPVILLHGFPLNNFHHEQEQLPHPLKFS